MHQLLPQFILEKYKNKEQSGSMSAISLFVDITGFSSLTDQLMSEGTEGSEKLAETMRSVFTPLINTIYHYNGFVATLAGDAINAIFIHENNKAINDALECVSHMPFILEHLEGDLEFSARFGLAYGEVKWGIVESETKTQTSYYFSGTAIDKAVESQQKAGNNQILVHESLYQKLADSSDLGLDALSLEKIEEELYLFSQRSSTSIEAQVNELNKETLELSQNFFPKQILEQELFGEFRQVVNVFIYLPTVRTETQLKLFMQSLFALQESYGGMLNRLDFSDKGTHLYLFWGAPITYENDIERALSFILDLQSQTSLAISAGLSYRMSHAGFIGSSLREEYTCYGRGVNLAARLMVDAPRGEVWLDEEIAKRVESSFDVELEGEFKFKGFSAKEKVFVLYERKEESENFFEGGLLGREEELKILETFIKPIFENQYAGNLVVTGEAGIGKSHLLKGLEDSELAKDSLWLSCQTNQILVSSLNPFTYILKKYFGTSDSQGENRNKRNFNRKLNNLIDTCADPELADELDRTQSFLGALLGLKWPDSLYEQLEPKSRLENSFLALIAFFQTLSLEQPLVLLVEDVHWLDSDSKTFLLRLQRVVNSSEESFAIAVLLTARPTENALPEALNYEILELNELNLTNIQSLITNSLGNASEELINLVFERSQGNPFFAEQIIRYLQEEKQVVLKDDIWQLSPNQKKKALPLDVRSVLIARIDRLSQDIKELVQTAAILGREFEVQLLSQIMQSEDLSLKLNEAEKAAVWTSLSELRYLFKHALLRDAAYDMQLVSRRKALHKLSVEALENVYKHDLENHYAELAYHSEQAQLTEKAKRYLELAGDSAKEAYQNEQAIDFYTRALTLSSENDKGSFFELKLKREAVYGVLGQHKVQQVELDDLRELAEQLDDDAQIRTLIRKAIFCFERSEYEQSIEIAQEALKQLEFYDNTYYLAEVHLVLGRVYSVYQTYNAEVDLNASEEHLKKSIELAELSQNKELQAQGLTYLGMLYRYNYDTKAKNYFEGALVLTKNLVTKSALFNRLGSIARRLEDYDGAQKLYEEALLLDQKTGHKVRTANTFFLLGLLLFNKHELVDANTWFAKAHKAAQELQNEGLIFNARYMTTNIAWKKGKLSKALEAHLNHYTAIQSTSSRGKLVLQEVIGLAFSCLGRLKEAETYVKAYLQAITPLQYKYDEIKTREFLTDIYIDLDDLEQAAEQLMKAQDLIKASTKIESSGGAIQTTEELKARLFLTNAKLALHMNKHDEAEQHLDKTLPLTNSFKFETSEFSYFFYRLYLVLKTLNRSEARPILNQTYQQIMKVANKVAHTEEELKQYWQEDRFMRGIVEAWQAENL